MNGSGVGGDRHHTIESVDLADNVTLAQSADRGIARHRADRADIRADERSPRAAARGRTRRFHAGMPSTDDDDIEIHDHALEQIA